MLYKCNTFSLFYYKVTKGQVMKLKTPKILGRVIMLSFITVGIIYATRLVHLSNISPETTYSNMSTMQLQIEVERLSQNGCVSFPMGTELVKRWTKNNGTVANY